MLDQQEPEHEIVFKTDSKQESDIENSDEEPKEVNVRPTRVRKPAIQMNIADTKGKSYTNVSFKDQVEQGQRQVERCHNIVKQTKNKEIVYEDYEALIFCHIMQMMIERTKDNRKSFAQ